MRCRWREICLQRRLGAQVDALASSQLIADHGGEVKRENGARNLAYRMNKNRKGNVLFNIDAPAPAVAELERTMHINEDVLRYLTLRVDALEEGPSPIMLNRGTREDRPRRSDRDRYDDRGDRGDRDRGSYERAPAERAPAEPTPAEPAPAEPAPAVEA